MGSLESCLSLKRDPSLLRSSSATSKNERYPFDQRPRSRFARLVLFKRPGYLEWICTVVVFFFFVVVFQMLLPGSLMEKSGNFLRDDSELHSGDLSYWKEFGELDFGEDVKFEPSKLLSKFNKDHRDYNNGSLASRRGVRFGCRNPRLALVFSDLLVDPYQIQMVSVATALREIGYEIEVYSLKDGPVGSVWRHVGISIKIVGISVNAKTTVDWLNYDGILVNSLEAAEFLSCLMQEPFKSVPLVWTIQERSLAIRLRQYVSTGLNELLGNWKKIFNRATVVVFPNYVLAMCYSKCDAGNFFVIPGSPSEAWEVDNFETLYEDDLRPKMDCGSDDFIVAIVGSQLLYRGLWLEHALILQALLPLLGDFPIDSNSISYLKIIILSGHSTSNYSLAVETIALKLGFPRGKVKHVAAEEDADTVLNIADLVIYGSLNEEQSFPGILVKAMCYGKPIIAPDLSMIRKYVVDKVNGYLFPKENVKILTQIVLQVISKGKLSRKTHNIASVGKQTAKNMMALETMEGYASLLEGVLKLPSEVAPSRAVVEIPTKLKAVWQWHLFEFIAGSTYPSKTVRIHEFLDKLEKQWNHTVSSDSAPTSDETFLFSIWERQKYIDIANARKRREEDELKDRTDQPRGMWEDMYRSAKRADRSKNDLHEMDNGELERTGRPLCIYEPYFGEGTWPFLHNTTLYRGLGLSNKGRRSGADDVDASSRLPLLSNIYYRDVLGEYGAFFAIANRIDRIHKNAWIGFHSWRVTARQESLSKTAEHALLDSIQACRHGDTLYFWSNMDIDPRNPLHLDFWSFCDAINAGNCKFTFSETMRKMYSIKHNLTSLPPMPVDGDTWSVMHCWVLPTRSFMEFVMFSRMFVDALDAEFYDEHYTNGTCYLRLSQDKRCYSRLLELLINVWAYHSARRMVYINPETGVMQEQHQLRSRRGRMWIKWFQLSTLKRMDEDLAEESDSDHPRRRRIWPSTGEVFWQGMYEKKDERNKEKDKRRQQSKDKISRIRRRARQKTLGKFVTLAPGS